MHMRSGDKFPTNLRAGVNLGFFCALFILLSLASCFENRPSRPGFATSAGKQGANTGDGDGTGDASTVNLRCDIPQPGKSPIRRLTRFEYNNTIRDLFDDNSGPASFLAAEELGNGFGNDAASQSVSSLLVTQYNTLGLRIAESAISKSASLLSHAPCIANVTAGEEENCVRTFLKSFLPKAYRRAITDEDSNELFQLFKTLRPTQGTFKATLVPVIAAVLQSPDFLYRVEFGQKTSQSLRISGREMANRLSYFFWASIPDAALLDAAAKGKLDTNEGVYEHAQRLLDDPKSKVVIYYFLDQLLPINALTDLERDKEIFPTFSAKIGSLMYKETHEFLDHVLFDGGPGDWGSAFSANYTFLNEPLAKFYGIEGLTGEAFQKVDLEGKNRLGLLTQGAFLAGSSHSSTTNPVARGAFIMQKIMCRPIPLPTSDLAELATPPKPTANTTARERFGAHSTDKVCQSCHKMMDPIGLTFENYDAVGLYRSMEGGKTIDASGALPDGLDNAGTATNAIELSRRIATSKDTQICFSNKWMTFALGKILSDGDSCSQDRLRKKFEASGFNVKKMLLEITQTDAFLYREPIAP